MEREALSMVAHVVRGEGSNSAGTVLWKRRKWCLWWVARRRKQGHRPPKRGIRRGRLSGRKGVLLRLGRCSL
eukprot:1348382-Pleurochrysis_carterae.AAC.1